MAGEVTAELGEPFRLSPRERQTLLVTLVRVGKTDPSVYEALGLHVAANSRSGKPRLSDEQVFDIASAAHKRALERGAFIELVTDLTL